MDSKQIAGSFWMYVTNQMEKYRAETFATKEPETIRWINAFKPDNLFIDVGANIGLYSLYAASQGVSVLAIEPDWNNYARLCDNIMLNNLEGVTPLNIGVSNHNQFTTFNVIEDGIGKSGSQVGTTIDDNGDDFTPVATRGILTLMLSELLFYIEAGKRVYIKIDVDGLEGDIVDGATSMLLSTDSVLVEINSERTNIQDITDKMSVFGLLPDKTFNKSTPHSSERRGGNPVNMVYTRHEGLK